MKGDKYAAIFKFYNSLDVLNKIMFFGIIIVIILTIITLIIYSKKVK